MKKSTFANVISTVGHPFALLSFLGVWIYFKNDFPADNFLMFGIIGLAVTSMIVYLLIKKNQGEISNFDVSQRQQRTQIYKIASLVLGILVVLFYVTNQPKLHTTLLFFVFILILIGSFINTKLKMSLHTATAVFVGCVMLQQNSLIGFCILVFAGIIAWSRLVLRRHKLTEIMAGAVVGTLIGLGYLYAIHQIL